MARFRQHGDGQLAQRLVQRAGDIAQVLFQRQIEIDSAFSAWADNQLFHIHIRRVEEAAFIADRHHCQGISLAHRRHPSTFDGIDGDIHRIALAGAHFFADIEHRRFIDFALADNDGAVDIDEVKHNAHGVNRCAVGGVFIAAAKPFIARQRGGFGDTRKFDGQFSFHNPLIV